MEVQMFQFMFISIVSHYGVEMSGFKTTGNAEKKCESRSTGCAEACTRARSRVISSRHSRRHHIYIHVTVLHEWECFQFLAMGW